MHHLSSRLVHLVVLFVVVVSLATAANSVPATPAINRPEAQLSTAEMEKFLEGLTRYLHRQQVNHFSSEEEQDDVAPDRKVPMSSSAEERISEVANNSITHPRPVGKWPWSLANSERDAASNIKQQRQPYGKRNSELINSLLGLPRIMKVVG